MGWSTDLGWVRVDMSIVPTCWRWVSADGAAIGAHGQRGEHRDDRGGPDECQGDLADDGPPRREGALAEAFLGGGAPPPPPAPPPTPGRRQRWAPPRGQKGGPRGWGGGGPGAGG